jgi:hypothetical protein
MGFSRRKLDPRTRRQVAFGNLCLAVGLGLFTFAHPSGQIEKNLVHALSGLLLGISIGVNLCALRLARRCRRGNPAQSAIETPSAPQP